jgi:radical SAM superfamily enzyme YgiQ (UPF0313 family)
MSKPIPVLDVSDRGYETGNGSAKALSVCLVTCLSLIDFIDPELTVDGAKDIMPGNIGLLTLVAVLRQHGYQPHFVNLDQLFLDFRRQGRSRSVDKIDDQASDLSADNSEPTEDVAPTSPYFFQFATEHLKSLSFDVFGFSSICSSYPLTLRLAEEVKRLNPTSRIILGGPQASVVDVATMAAFRNIDFIVRGEAERTFPALLDLIGSGEDSSNNLENLRGLSFRRGDEVIRNPNAAVLEKLDDLPLPAFDLDPNLRDRGSAYLEIGRGCPFVCSFCSTNDFFRRNFRLKSAQKMIEEMRHIKQEYGIGNFSLIHDMYTVDRKKVIAFCEALLASGENFTWACSARTDCIDDELISLMAKAGCRGIFFGIETGSPRLQTVIKKKLDLSEARKRIQCADHHGIKMAVALITGFPDETRDDFRDTIHFFVDSLRFDYAEPQLSLLAPLAATPIYDEHKTELILDHIFSDMSYQGWQQDPADVDLIRSYQDIFPNYYAVPTVWLDRNYFKEVRDFVTYVTTRFRWLPVALLQDSGDLLHIFDRWKMWLAEKSADDAQVDSVLAPYYCREQFRKDFLEFVRNYYLEEQAKARPAITALLQSEGAEAGNREPMSASVERTDELAYAYFPFLAENVFVMDLGVDYKELVECLRTKAGLRQVTERNVTIAFRPKGRRQTQVWQLTPLSAALIRQCDGKRSVADIIQNFGLVETDMNGVSPEKACLFGLLRLREDGLIGISSRPNLAEGESGLSEGQRALIPRHSPPPQLSNTQQPWPWPAPNVADGPS